MKQARHEMEGRLGRRVRRTVLREQSAAVEVVGSHAGVDIGADGPSQMALEDLAMMRAM